MKNKFHTSRGFLTLYALACGYNEVAYQYVNTGNDKPLEKQIKVSMYLDGCFHVKVYENNGYSRLSWNCYDTLPEARKAFMQACKDNNVKRKINH